MQFRCKKTLIYVPPSYKKLSEASLSAYNTKPAEEDSSGSYTSLKRSFKVPSYSLFKVKGFKIRKIMKHPKIARIIFEIKEMIKFQTTLESESLTFIRIYNFRLLRFQFPERRYSPKDQKKENSAY
jgi:hypothetical protein